MEVILFASKAKTYKFQHFSKGPCRVKILALGVSMSANAGTKICCILIHYFLIFGAICVGEIL